MSDIFWLSDEQFNMIKRYFPSSHGVIRDFLSLADSPWQKTKSCSHRMHQKNDHHSQRTDGRLLSNRRLTRNTVASLVEAR